ncbi:hypothetical protein BOTBODRAFT_122285, partial [Botryobasidium botryosum FD-172 SS1]
MCLDDGDINSIKAFVLTMDEKGAATLGLYNRIRATFPQLCIRSFYKTRQRLRNVAGLKAQTYPMCPSSCRAFVKEADIAAARAHGCTSCGSAVFVTRQGKLVPALTFDYLPLMPRVVALWGNEKMAKILQTYRADYAKRKSNDDIEDVFDGEIYPELCQTEACYKGTPLGHLHFHRATDLALGFWADGFQLFSTGNNDC